MADALGKSYGYKLIGGASFTMQGFPEAATQSFNEADFLELSSGKVQPAWGATVATAEQLESGGGACLGRALRDASTTTDTNIEVLLAGPHILFELGCMNSGTSVTAGVARAITNIGSLFPIYTTATDIWAYDITDNTNPVIEVFDLKERPDWTITQQGGSAWCHVIDAELDLGG